MNERELAGVLDLCLEAMAAGDSMAACLARHPKQAGVLEPMLAAAADLQALNRNFLSARARQRAKARLGEAQALRRSGVGSRPAPAAWWLRLGVFRPSPALAGLVVAVCLVLLSAGLVAASQPGDLAYGLRVAAERVPARLAASPEARAQAELGAADRRVNDLQRSLGQGIPPDGRAVTALLAGDEAAARIAASLTSEVQAQIAARIRAQADRLEILSGTAPVAAGLRDAAARAYQAAQAANPDARPRAATPAPPPAQTQSPTRAPEATPAGAAAPGISPTSARTASPGPAATSGRVQPTRQPTVSTPAPAEGGRAPQMTSTPAGTAVQRTEATPPDATATPMKPAGGATPTPSNPGPAPTAPGAGPAATAAGPGPDSTSPGPGGGSSDSGPGSGSSPRGSGSGRK
jgi:hypothetical protein